MLGRLHAVPSTADLDAISLGVLCTLIFFVGYGIGNDTTMLAEAEAACATAHAEGRRTVRVFDALTCGPAPLPVRALTPAARPSRCRT